MQIVIDLQGVQNQSNLRGIGRYILSYVRALIRNRGNHEIIALLSGLFPDSINSISSTLLRIDPEIQIKVWNGVAPTAFGNQNNKWRRLSSQLIREAFIKSLEPDFLIIGSLFDGGADDTVTSIGQFSKIPTAVIHYDLIPWIYPVEYLTTEIALNWYAEKVEYLKKADVLLAISDTSRLEAIKYLRIAREKVVNISAAIEPVFKKRKYESNELAAILDKFKIKFPFLLYSGASDPRKNIPNLLEAYSCIPSDIRESHQLVLAGGMPAKHISAFQNQALSFGLKMEEFVFTGRISDDDLISLYSLCKAYILPSLHEGFGLTALEAMACGAPTIGSNRSSIPEVIGFSEALFDPRSIEQMTAIIVRVLTDQKYRSVLMENGSFRSNYFSWDKTALLTYEKLESVYNESDYRDKRSCLQNDNIADFLIKKIANIDDFHATKHDVLNCAKAIAHNFKEAR